MVVRALLFLLVFAATFLVRDHFFFWDTVQLASKHAHFFYRTNFSAVILPEVIDSGHPPAFGMYLALCWKIFGKTLTVSHFAMIPFLLGIVYFLLKLGEEWIGRTGAPWLVLLCFADPVLAAQSVLVSPDIALVCFFLMGLWAIWNGKNNWLLVLSIAGLGLVSMRGMALGVGLFLYYWMAMDEKMTAASFFKKLAPFLPGGIIALLFMIYHYQQTGWIGYHESSTWAPSFERVGAKGFFKNIAVLGWRMLDFGRVFCWLALLIGLIVLFKKQSVDKIKEKSVLKKLILLFFITFIALVINQLPYRGLLAHRYLLPIFLSLNFLIGYILFNRLGKTPETKGLQRILTVVVLVGLVSGNLWVYPKKISQGWDSTLAHLPWYELQEAAENFITRNKIPYQEVGTAFPNIGPREMIELNGIDEGFVEKNLSSDCYVLYSNIMNDFTDEEIDELDRSWQQVFRKEKRGVCVILYKNPDTLLQCNPKTIHSLTNAALPGPRER